MKLLEKVMESPMEKKHEGGKIAVGMTFWDEIV